MISIFEQKSKVLISFHGCNIWPGAWGKCGDIATRGDITIYASFSNDIFPTSVIIGYALLIPETISTLFSIVRVKLWQTNQTTTILEGILKSLF